MSRVLGRAKMLAKQLKNGDIKGVRGDIEQWMWSENYYCGLLRERDKEFTPTSANVSLTARPLDDELAPKVFNFDGLGERDATYLERRRRIWEAGFKNGFVAVDPEGNPAYLQWLIPPSQNAKVAEFFGPLFPLDDTTLVVEGAWIPPAFRKENVMGEGLSKVTEAAFEASAEATAAICFPELKNKGAVRGSASGGYDIAKLRTDTWRLGRRTSTFSDFSVEQANEKIPGLISHA